MISVNSCKRALSSGIFANKHSTPTVEAMLTRASMAIFLSFAMNPSWSNKFLNLELHCKVVIAAVGRLDFLLHLPLDPRKSLSLLHPSLCGLGVGFFERLAGIVLESFL